MFKNYISYILFWLFVILLLAATFYLQEILLPFFLGLLLALASKGPVLKIQKKIKKRNLSVVVYLTSIFVSIGLLLFLFSAYINHDAHRLQEAFKTFAHNNQEEIDEGTQKVADFIAQYYNPDEIRRFVDQKKDSVLRLTEEDELDFSQLDYDAIKQSAESVFAFFQSPEETGVEKEEKTSASMIVIFFSTIFYFVYILFYLDYFSERWEKYMLKKSNGIFKIMAEDINSSFFKYFKLRSKILLVLMMAYLIGFSILGVPGAIIFALLAGILAYIPYLQYLTLLPLSLSCLILSMETQHNFFIFFGFVVGIFIVMSIIEELILIPKIMEANIGINPVIMIVSVSLWTYVLGLFGVLIAIPLTSLIITYVKRIVFNEGISLES
jgi:predicted PurR-regulated permease PerM